MSNIITRFYYIFKEFSTLKYHNFRTETERAIIQLIRLPIKENMFACMFDSFFHHEKHTIKL